MHIPDVENQKLPQAPEFAKPATETARVGLTLVVPCFNEIDGIEQLDSRINALRSTLVGNYDFETIFVDDGSGDGTGDALEKHFRCEAWARVVRHEANRGIAAAIMTGIRNATHDWVASIDADCTYDPSQLHNLLRQMNDDTSIITASPYHPEGAVEGVPSWRLGLSKAASALYRSTLGMKLCTYTSCFRIVRRQDLLNVSLTENGFVGVAEMLWLVKRNGGSIREVPAILTSRRIGYSKMKTLPVIFAHVKLLSRIAKDRLLNPSRYRHLPD